MLVSTTLTFADSAQRDLGIQACWARSVCCCPCANSEKTLAVLVDNETQSALMEDINAIRNPKASEQAPQS